ncbi:TIGR04100 family radical SAM protein [Youxingia wuxianensis]|uniref:TIGR04100 family radical SAM protein n=1 Tax=Youxingia wuxianensis TaxID=2763678 RepID=A0A926EPT8_9FIRM|nr:TIGR04100 family radical SAM protein [Youxingia wuxianensis]MBC8584139.1 TIGR04100 family radical SAM protein [Youxingia wuxianensis]
MTNILYIYDNNLYVNLTNQCPCRCTFCIRSQKNGLGSSDNLWLEHTPTAHEVIAAFKKYSLSDFEQVIFCGYGEPLCALDELISVCNYIRSISDIKIRLNTNGLGDLINCKPTAPLLKGVVDAVSISLNAPDAAKYLQVTRPSFGAGAFESMLKFAQECKQYIPEVKFSVVDVISKEDILACQNLADRMDIPLRVRHFNS